jgi:hypothetical protein
METKRVVRQNCMKEIAISVADSEHLLINISDGAGTKEKPIKFDGGGVVTSVRSDNLTADILIAMLSVMRVHISDSGMDIKINSLINCFFKDDDELTKHLVSLSI